MNENTQDPVCPDTLEPAQAQTPAPTEPEAPQTKANAGSEAEATASDTPVAEAGAMDAPDPKDRSALAESIPFDPAELARLRSELTSLRQELTQKQELALRFGKECAEFQELYPEVSLSAVPDEVWDSVKNGVPLSAAFALAERRRSRLEACAQKSNRSNLTSSAGELREHTPGYFSFDEVKRMSRAEIRQNYDGILRSMQKWH